MAEACKVCGTTEGNVRYMCDEEVDGVWCGTHYDECPCGKGQHGEGCGTMVIEGGDAA